MLWRALFRGNHVHHESEGVAFGVMAGLIPCPLTLFVMTFAVARDVPEAGVLFAVVMMLGVAFTLPAVALSAVLFLDRMMRLFNARPRLIASVSRGVEVTAGLVLVAVAIRETALHCRPADAAYSLWLFGTWYLEISTSDCFQKDKFLTSVQSIIGATAKTGALKYLFLSFFAGCCSTQFSVLSTLVLYQIRLF
ncbi:urease accessory protein UreH domain-containing protein [Neorhizobium galegae]|uniref:urease accessory protein UreH domain-containing protein n=1 Tax=Neorhizobium galegae TaxID=399 RepID=UPI000621454F|nr:sulfite exporter TauE/SafE family protein [Neorhizobium galegae]MCQ1809966.1 sulfite exporter TauE/SafE family protein [Neorhizobium galegae]CDZ61292.1 Hypothetical protein NGAL_HAMBI2566_44340 [Neorhizobium galegae bv. orientalis]